MDSMADRLNKLREERIAREKARITKLRELNLKKYNQDLVKNTPQAIKHVSSNRSTNNVPPNTSRNSVLLNITKNNVHVTSKNTIPPHSAKSNVQVQPKVHITNSAPRKISMIQQVTNSTKLVANSTTNNTISVANNKITTHTTIAKRPLTVSSDKGPTKKLFSDKKTQNESSSVNNFNLKKELPNSAKKQTLIPRKSISTSSNVSVFERLYKPKLSQTRRPSEPEMRKNSSVHLPKANQSAGNISNRRHTVCDKKLETKAALVRRSISAVHLKRIDKNQLVNCIHKWASIGDSLNVDLKQVNEDDNVNEDRIVSAIKSDRKRVTFMTPSTNFNTPKPEELQSRLKAWLQKRGKSLDSYHHLQCFGIHHLPHNLKFDPKLYEDEDKENICVESDSDDDSYSENMNKVVENKNNKWRTASIVSDSVDLSESQNTTLTCSEGVNTDEVVVGALSDLTDLLKEGFDWMQCARWLRAIRERFPSALNSAAYWECRAALEEMRGDLPASVKCWEEAIIQGTQRSVVEANLDQLLDKFMQLQISPNRRNSHEVDPKFVDVKNVFKSTIIRFAVQQAKLRESNSETPGKKYCVTPVRRSARLSGVRTPLQLCTSVRQAPVNTLFVRNQHLNNSP